MDRKVRANSPETHRETKQKATIILTLKWIDFKFTSGNSKNWRGHF